MPSTIINTATVHRPQPQEHSDTSDRLQYSVTMINPTNQITASRRAHVGRRPNNRHFRGRLRRSRRDPDVSQEQSQPGSPSPPPPAETQVEERNLLRESLVAFENDLAEWKSGRQSGSRTREDRKPTTSPDCSINNDTWTRFRQFVALAPVPQKVREILRGTVGGMHFPKGEIYWYYSHRPKGHVTLLSSRRFTSLGPFPRTSSRRDAQSSTATTNELPARHDSPDARWNSHAKGSPARHNETAFVLNTFTLVLELLRYRLAWGHSVFAIRLNNGCASFDLDAAEAVPHLPCPIDMYSLTILRRFLLERISYIYDFKQWYAAATASGPYTRQPFQFGDTFAEPCLEVDVYLFRTGVLDEQYSRNKRRFKFSEDTLCQMYGVGLHELVGLLDMDMGAERTKCVSTLEDYHKLMCCHGPTTVQDISKQTSWVSYAIRNVRLARRGNFKAGSVDETIKARQREFAITELLVEAVTRATIFVNTNRGEKYFHRHLPHQPRSTNDFIGEQDWEKLTLADQKRLLGNKTRLFHLYINEATAGRHAPDSRNAVVAAAVEPRTMTQGQRRNPQALYFQSSAVQTSGPPQEALDPRTVTGFPPDYVPRAVASFSSLDSDSSPSSSSQDPLTPMDFAQQVDTSAFPSEFLLPSAGTQFLTQECLSSGVAQAGPATTFFYDPSGDHINYHGDDYSYLYRNNHTENQRYHSPAQQNASNVYCYRIQALNEIRQQMDYCQAMTELLVQYRDNLYDDQPCSQTVVDSSNRRGANNRSTRATPFIGPRDSWDHAISAGFMYNEIDYNRENMLTTMVPSEYADSEEMDDYDPFMPANLREEWL